jgi:hypothetical protein
MDVSITTTIKVTKSSETGFPISCQVMDSERCPPMVSPYASSRPGDRFDRRYAGDFWGCFGAKVGFRSLRRRNCGNFNER